MTTTNDEIHAGGDAAALLESRAFRDATAHILGNLERQRRTCDIKDTALHSRLILLEQCWQTLILYLEQTKQSGDWAALKVQEEAEKQQRAIRLGSLELRY